MERNIQPVSGIGKEKSKGGSRGHLDTPFLAAELAMPFKYGSQHSSHASVGEENIAESLPFSPVWEICAGGVSGPCNRRLKEGA